MAQQTSKTSTPQTETQNPQTLQAPSDNLVIVDANQLAATIAAAVAQTMAQMAAGQTAPTFDMTQLGNVIGEAVAHGIARNTRKKVTIGEYEALGPRNSYHPKSKAETPRLKRNLWQNGTLCMENTLFDAEIELANRITHSGRYCDRKVEVIFNEEDVHIRYNNKTRDMMFELKNYFRSLKELLEIIVKQQEAEDKDVKEREEELRAEREARLRAKERHFGDNKEYREAVATANAQ